MQQNDKICFSSSVIRSRIIALASILTTLVTDQNSNLNDQFTINKIEAKQIKPTIIYNETQWTPIVPLNYKTQIAKTQWVVLSINLQPRNSVTIREKNNNKTKPKLKIQQNNLEEITKNCIFKHACAHKTLHSHTVFFLHSLKRLSFV